MVGDATMWKLIQCYSALFQFYSHLILVCQFSTQFLFLFKLFFGLLHLMFLL